MLLRCVIDKRVTLCVCFPCVILKLQSIWYIKLKKNAINKMSGSDCQQDMGPSMHSSVVISGLCHLTI